MKSYKIRSFIIAALLLGFTATATAQEQPASSFWRRLQSNITAILADITAAGSGAATAGQITYADGAGALAYGGLGDIAGNVEDLSTAGAAGEYLVAGAGGALAMEPWHNRSPEAAVTLVAGAFAAVNGTAYYVVTGEGAVADDIATIAIPAGFPDGGIIKVRSADPAEPVTLVDTTPVGNITTPIPIPVSPYAYAALRLDGAGWTTALGDTPPSIVGLGVASDLNAFFEEVRNALLALDPTGAPLLVADTIPIVHNAGPLTDRPLAFSQVFGRFGYLSDHDETTTGTTVSAGGITWPIQDRAGNPDAIYYQEGGAFAGQLAAINPHGEDLVALSSHTDRVVAIRHMADPAAAGVQVFVAAAGAGLEATLTGLVDVDVPVAEDARVPQPEISPFTP